MHGPGTDEPIVWYEGSGTIAKNWFYADHLGSIGRGDSRVNIYNDKTTGQRWIWDGKKGSGKEQL